MLNANKSTGVGRLTSVQPHGGGKRAVSTGTPAGDESRKRQGHSSPLTPTEAAEEIKRLNEEVVSIKLGYPDLKIPTPEEIQKQRRKLSLSSSTINVAVAGLVRQGRSEFLRAISSWRCEDQLKPIKWAEIKGADTSSLNYCTDHKLYAYDMVVILMGGRVSTIDVGIAFILNKCQVPYIFVRTKSDQTVDSLKNEIPEMDEKSISNKATDEAVQAEVAKARDETIAKLNKELSDQGLPEAQFGVSLFWISSPALKAVAEGKTTTKTVMDEKALLEYFAKLRGMQKTSDEPIVQIESPQKENFNLQQNILETRIIPANDSPSQSRQRRIAIIGTLSPFHDAIRIAVSEASSISKDIEWVCVSRSQAYDFYNRTKVSEDNEKLFGYQAIIILIGEELTETDLRLLKLCTQKEIACLLVLCYNMSRVLESQGRNIMDTSSAALAACQDQVRNMRLEKEKDAKDFLTKIDLSDQLFLVNEIRLALLNTKHTKHKEDDEERRLLKSLEAVLKKE